MFKKLRNYRIIIEAISACNIFMLQLISRCRNSERVITPVEIMRYQFPLGCCFLPLSCVDNFLSYNARVTFWVNDNCIFALVYYFWSRVGEFLEIGRYELYLWVELTDEVFIEVGFLWLFLVILRDYTDRWCC